MSELAKVVTESGDAYANSENSTSSRADILTLTPAHTNNYAYLLVLLLSLSGLMGNLMVILAISKVNKLRTNTNLILASLALADLLVCMIVMPLSVLHLITGVWQLGDVGCSMYVFLDVCLCTCSILHMCTISFDRYLGIAFPLRYSNFRTKKATWLKIVGIWFVAGLLACPILIHAFVDRNSINLNGACAINNQAFQIYGSLCAFYIPLIAMTTTYFLTIRELSIASQLGNKEQTLRRVRGNSLQRRNDRQSYSKDSSSCSVLSAGSSIRSIAAESRERGNGSSGRSTSANTSYCGTGSGREETILANLADKRKKLVGHRLSCSQCQSSMPLLVSSAGSDTIPEHAVLKVKYHSTEHIIRRSMDEISSSFSYGYDDDTDGKQTRHRKWRQMRSRTSLAEMLARLKSKKILTSQMDKERKATQVLGFVFLAFVVCWMPFFLINIIQPLCGARCQFSESVMNFVVWLGYSASIANPIIYTIINKQFQKAFRLWLRRRDRPAHSLKSCIGNLNGHVMAVTSALATPHALPSTSS